KAPGNGEGSRSATLPAVEGARREGYPETTRSVSLNSRCMPTDPSHLCVSEGSDSAAAHAVVAHTIAPDTVAARDPLTRSDRVIDRFGERGEQLRPLLGHGPAVLQPDAELPGDVDTGLVGETHPRLQRCCVIADEVRVLVAVEADAVSGTM